MTPFVAQVPIRWTDQDAYGHLNNARAITLLEEARISFLWSGASAADVRSFGGGLLVAGLHADYVRQVAYRSDITLRVAMTVDEIRAASFRILYELRVGPADDDPVAITAWTRMAMVDMANQRPRRLVAQEKAFLARYATS